MKHSVLFVDDEPEITEGLKRTLRKEPYAILSAHSAKEALDLLECEHVDVVVSDEKMPGMSGTEFLAVVKKKYPETIRMVLTGHANLDAAVRAINEGQIFRFLTKPCNETDLVFTIRQALRQKELLKKANQLLQTSKRQSKIIEHLERTHPEILKVERDKEGAIVINETAEELDPDKLLQEISEETKKYNKQ